MTTLGRVDSPDQLNRTKDGQSLTGLSFLLAADGAPPLHYRRVHRWEDGLPGYTREDYLGPVHTSLLHPGTHHHRHLHATYRHPAVRQRYPLLEEE